MSDMQNTCKFNMQINVLILQGLIRHSVMTEWHTHTLPHSAQPKDSHHMPFSWALGRSCRQELSGQADKAAGKEEQAVSCDYLLCFGAEWSGSRWGEGDRGDPSLRRP